MKYEPVIGLEVHVHLKTEAKIFCACSAVFGGEANSRTCPVCLGLPGTLPVLNEKVIRYAIMAGLSLGAEIASNTKFDRKNYFYPDLPKAYQISQFDRPLCSGGSVPIPCGEGVKHVTLRRIHLEEDAGKLFHEEKRGQSLVDYNRTGVPLIEIVSEPDLQSPREAFDFLKTLKLVLEYLKVSDCNMEEGSLRCDANVSIRPMGSMELGTKTEVKNMNSFRGVEKALEFEIQRQVGLIEEGGSVVQETRLWDAEREITQTMRTKEEAHDYRYFPEPDLVPVLVGIELVEEIRGGLPEMPYARKQRFAGEYGIPERDAGVLTSDRDLADYYEETLKYWDNPKALSNWVMGDFLAKIKEAGADVSESPVRPGQLAELIKLIDQGTISGKIAKEVFIEMFDTGKSPGSIVGDRGLVQITDESQLDEIIARIIEENPKTVEDFRSGKKNALSFLVGQIMKATRGKASPQLANRLLNEKLGEK